MVELLKLRRGVVGFGVEDANTLAKLANLVSENRDLASHQRDTRYPVLLDELEKALQSLGDLV